ncbi:MAG: DEAD/DEAH box helicase, partial [Sphingomonadaceae bacterium]|nr:DEAD/DEAH box helicase [Sphingomonadaceae bacterium]
GLGGPVLTVNTLFTLLFDVAEERADRDTLIHLLGEMQLPEGVRQELRASWLSTPVRDPAVRRGEFRLVTSEGQPLDVEWYSAPVYQESSVLGRIYTFHDVSPERAAQRLRAAFLSRISHELRTPLTSIRGFAEFILEATGDQLPDLAREYTEIILDSAKHLNTVFTDMIEITRADPGELKLNKVEAHLPDIIIGVVARLELQYKARKQQVIMELDDDLPMVSVDIDRLTQVLEEHGLGNLKRVASLAEAQELKPGEAGLAVLPLEAGFETQNLVVVAEQDILGDRLIRRAKRRRKASDFIAEVAALSAGDIVVHADHGIGRFVGLKTIEAAGAPHDCLEIRYAGDDRLFLPVENIELLSRYGSESTEAVLDKLGGVAWQSRKAKLKRKLLEMAGQLIKLAAERQMRPAPVITPPDGLYGEFSARFPYDETDDQLSAIEAVTEDLAAGRPMDRLICGDVGFGKTEVALRAAFLAAMEGFQVAVVVPTTLLARQHFRTFSQRFAGLPVTVRQASRLVGSKELAETRKGLADGTVDIVVGTHALLGSSITFKDLGLLIVDEEQHFGVKHKERLKELKSDVHVLTLSATPIPRTLQLALTGVRELSLIATPPVDRMAVRTFISPFDPLVIRETLLRERYRGGQSFYVVPRISDLPDIRRFLEEQVPELKVATAHGQMAAGELDDIMNAFYDGQYDVLLSTTIVESGLDIPTANTMIVHRADMF